MSAPVDRADEVASNTANSEENVDQAGANISQNEGTAAAESATTSETHTEPAPAIAQMQTQIFYQLRPTRIRAPPVKYSDEQAAAAGSSRAFKPKRTPRRKPERKSMFSNIRGPGPVQFTKAGEEQFEVERIITSFYNPKLKKEEYFLKWYGYTFQSCTWEVDIACPTVEEDYRLRVALCREMRQTIPAADIREYPYDLIGRCEIVVRLMRLAEFEAELNLVCKQHDIAPIWVENWIDDMVYPHNFKFIQENVFHESARKIMSLSDKNQKCKCKNTRYCQEDDCCARAFKAVFPYDGDKLVAHDYRIVECSDLCSCSIDCPSRLIQRGRQITIFLFRTKNSGWGIRTVEFIEKDSFIMEYKGEVIASDLSSRENSSYQFHIDTNGAQNAKFVIDATDKGNEARWINHSCDPNMFVRGVYATRFDDVFENLAFFAGRDINPGEELTFDYYSNLQENENLVEGLKCQCGSSKCRIYLM